MSKPPKSAVAEMLLIPFASDAVAFILNDEISPPILKPAVLIHFETSSSAVDFES